MNKELFGAFGTREDFERRRSPEAFDRVLDGPTLTVGVRNPAIGIPGRSAVYESDRGVCVLWGEVYLRSGRQSNPAQWLLSEYADRGRRALSELNGSYLAVIDPADGEAMVATDIVRSRECYYTDASGLRTFGTDPAAVAETIPEPETAVEPLKEFVDFGVILDDRTLLTDLQRTPFDGYVSADDAGDLRRFVYEPREFDYERELAERLRRAMARRSNLPGQKGLLMSGGYDSRVILAGVSDIETAFTIGTEDSSEVAVAKDVAAQYDTVHRVLELDENYLNTSPELVQYGHGLMESLHIHHGGYTDQMDVDTIYHGAFGDTLFRGHFLPVDGIEILDHKCPPYRLDPDPDVAAHFSEKLGYLPSSQRISLGRDSADEGIDFVRRRVEEVMDRKGDRYESIHNGMALFGIQNQPTRPFRHHLADNFVESCIFLDAELLEWHLSTPPEHRNTETFLGAIQRLDDDILRHQPPDRRHGSFTLNEIDNFLRRKLPLVSGYEGPWPNRRQLYERRGIDETIFGGAPKVHDLPWRLKLRINDATTWLDEATDRNHLTPMDLISQPIRQSRPTEQKRS